MSKIFVSSFDADGTKKNGTFDGRNNEIYHEDFKPVVFVTEEAKAKLSAYEAEREREDKAIPFTLEEAEKYAESVF